MFCCCAEEPKTSAQVIDTSPALEEQAPEKAPEPAAPEPPKPDPVPKKNESDVSFVAKLSRQEAEEPFGLKADFADERVVHVCRVTAEGGTAIERYNAAAPEDKKIKVGDYFTAVNGVSAENVPSDKKVSDALRDQLLSSKEVEVTVRRAEIFDCKITKNGKPAGLELSYSNNGLGLIVKKINDGAVKSSAPEVQPGDRIVAVGSVEGPPESLLEAIRNAGDIVLLKMSRCS